MKKILITLKEPVEGQKQFEFTSEYSDLSNQIALARDKAKMFSIPNIDSVHLTFGNNGKFLNITEMILSEWKTINLEEGVKWFTKAAKQGHANAQYNLGYCYEYGYGVEKDGLNARFWYNEAARQGQADATEALEKLKWALRV